MTGISSFAASSAHIPLVVAVLKRELCDDREAGFAKHCTVLLAVKCICCNKLRKLYYGRIVVQRYLLSV